jgi:hypothetical protein
LPGDKVFILFHTIHDVLRAEKILKTRGIPHELVPIPRNLSSDCGMCIRLDDDLERVRPYLDKIDIAGSYALVGDDYRRIDPGHT